MDLRKNKIFQCQASLKIVDVVILHTWHFFTMIWKNYWGFLTGFVDDNGRRGSAFLPGGGKIPQVQKSAWSFGQLMQCIIWTWNHHQKNNLIRCWKMLKMILSYIGKGFHRSRMVLSFILAGIRTASECLEQPSKAKKYPQKMRQEMNFPGKKLP